ncbi:MAG: hypothetical protein AAF997_11795 [Myxococcota bacterium]
MLDSSFVQTRLTRPPVVCCLAALATLVLFTQHARADVTDASNTDPPEPSAQEAALAEALQTAAADTKGFRFTTAGISLATGTALLSLGTVRLIQDPANNQIERGVGLMWLGVGAAGITTGLLLLLRKSPEEQTLRRWNERRASGEPLSQYELGSFAGELRAAAAFRARERRLVRWTALAGAGAGTLALSLIPAMDNLTNASRRNVFIVGSIFVGVGFLNFGLSFRKSGPEKAWEEYELGITSPEPRVQTSLSPIVAEGGAGLALSGTF